MIFLNFISLANAKCVIKITNYRGDLIAEENYTTNTQSFKINSTNCAKISITPERNVLYGIYDIGEYTITASSTNPEEENVSIKININDVPKEKRNYYYIFNHCGTFPMITTFFYLIFNLTNDINLELQVGRPNTFNFTKIKEDYPNTIYYSSDGDSFHTSELIRNISRDDPYSYFYVRVDDIRVGQPIYWLVNQGIHQSRYEVHLGSDGTGTYNIFYNNKINTTEGWNNFSQKFDEIYQNALIGNISTDYHIYNCNIDLDPLIFKAATHPNVFLELSNPEMLFTTDEALKPILKTMNLIKIDVVNIIKSQTKEKVDYLYEISMINETEYRKKYFTEGKKTCFILTSVPVNSLEIKSYFNQTLMKYPNYTFVAKPHPSGAYPIELAEWISSKLKFKIFENQQIPTELIYSAFPGELDVGGYQSSSLTSINFKDIPFIFVKNGSEDLFSPFNIFYQNSLLESYLMPFDSNYNPPNPSKSTSLLLVVGIPILLVVIIAAAVIAWYILFSRKSRAEKKVNAALLE